MEQWYFAVKLKGKPSTRLLQIFIDYSITGIVGLQIIPLTVFTFPFIRRVCFQLFASLATQKSTPGTSNLIQILGNWPIECVS